MNMPGVIEVSAKALGSRNCRSLRRSPGGRCSCLGSHVPARRRCRLGRDGAGCLEGLGLGRCRTGNGPLGSTSSGRSPATEAAHAPDQAGKETRQQHRAPAPRAPLASRFLHAVPPLSPLKTPRAGAGTGTGGGLSRTLRLSDEKGLAPGGGMIPGHGTGHRSTCGTPFECPSRM